MQSWVADIVVGRQCTSTHRWLVSHDAEASSVCQPPLNWASGCSTQLGSCTRIELAGKYRFSSGIILNWLTCLCLLNAWESRLPSVGLRVDESGREGRQMSVGKRHQQQVSAAAAGWQIVSVAEAAYTTVETEYFENWMWDKRKREQTSNSIIKYSIIV